jgi:hypothetical protein
MMAFIRKRRKDLLKIIIVKIQKLVESYEEEKTELK